MKCFFFLILILFVNAQAATITFMPQQAKRCSIVAGQDDLCAPKGTVVKIELDLESKIYPRYVEALLNKPFLLTEENVYFRRPFRILNTKARRTGYNEFYRPRSRLLDTHYEIFLIKD